MQINDEIRLDYIFDYANGRRLQIIAVNKDKNDPLFTVHRDMMGREYIKLKLDQQGIMALIKELQKGMVVPPGQINRFNRESLKKGLTLVKGDSDNTEG